MKTIVTFLVMVFATTVFAGFQGFNSTTSLGIFSAVKCSTGVTCTKSGDKLTLTTGTVSSGAFKNFSGWKPTAFADGNSTTPSATTVYLTQIMVPTNATLTGIKIANAATVGTNTYIVALFDSTGARVANSALAGTLTAGANGYQAVPFTSTYAVTGPGVYWIGLYVNGTTDRFYSVPAVGEIGGLAGSVTGQTFGTIVSVTLPTTFTANVGPVAFTY